MILVLRRLGLAYSMVRGVSAKTAVKMGWCPTVWRGVHVGETQTDQRGLDKHVALSVFRSFSVLICPGVCFQLWNISCERL